MNTIRTRHPTRIVQGIKGKIIHFKEEGGLYLKWFGFEDPTYDGVSVLAELDDDKIDIALAAIYIFNEREEAVAAQITHRQAVLDRRKPRV